jgi:hypothetical protein
MKLPPDPAKSGNGDAKTISHDDSFLTAFRAQPGNAISNELPRRSTNGAVAIQAR